MVPIFVFISPTFIYSFLEEKVQSSYNYLICVDFPLYAREINTKEISSVVLACKCCLKIQPDYQPHFLIPAGFLALSTCSTSWGRSIIACMVHGWNWGMGRLKIPRASSICFKYKSSSETGYQRLFILLKFPLPGCRMGWSTDNAEERLSACSSAGALK